MLRTIAVVGTFRVMVAGSGSSCASSRNSERESEKVVRVGLVMKRPHEAVTELCFSVTGRKLITGHSRGSICVWNSATGELLHRLRGKGEIITCLEVSADGQYLISGSGSGAIQLWEINSGRNVWTVQGHKGDVESIAFSQDGTIVASGGSDKQLLLSSVSDGKMVRTYSLASSTVTSVRVEPVTDAVLFAGTDKVIRKWDWRNDKPITHRKLGSRSFSVNWEVQSIACAIVGDAADVVIQVSSSANGESIGRLMTKDKTALALAFSRDGKRLASFGHWYNSKVSVWELASGTKIQDFDDGNAAKIVTALSFSPDGRYLASTSGGDFASIWDLSDVINMKGFSSSTDASELWGALGLEDGLIAQQAIWSLVKRKEEAVKLIKQRLRPIQSISSAESLNLLQRLESHRFHEREMACKQLTSLGNVVAPMLRKHSSSSTTSLDTRHRISTILHAIQREELRIIRVVTVLEHLSTPDAVDHLAVLATGDPHSFLTIQAKAAYARQLALAKLRESEAASMSSGK
jgi:hypothetical protein